MGNSTTVTGAQRAPLSNPTAQDLNGLAATPKPVKPQIDATAIRQSVAKTLKPKATMEHDDVFKAILKAVPEKGADDAVNFLKEAALDDGERLTQRDYIVVVIERVAKAAASINAGICRHLDFIYLFNGEYWQQCDNGALADFLGQAAERMGMPIMAARYCRTAQNLVDQFRYKSYMPTPKRKEGVTLLNFTNGTYEITATGQRLREFRHEDFLTYQLPFAYEPNACAPKWATYLDRVLPAESESGVKSRQMVLAEFVAWCFTDLKLEKALFLFGEGANGKSVFFEVITALLGEDNVTHYSLASLSDDKGYQRAKIADVLLNYASEVGAKVSSEYLKKLASREPVEARLPYGQPFTLKRYARLAFNANELPRDAEHSTAFFRRFLVIPFNETIPKAERNKTLHFEIIQSELSGVFNWVMAGLQRLLTRKDFSPCDVAEKAQEQFEYESDTVALFISEGGYVKADDEADLHPLKDIYKVYSAFSKDCGYPPVGSVKFSKRLKKLDFHAVHKNHGTCFFIKKPLAHTSFP